MAPSPKHEFLHCIIAVLQEGYCRTNYISHQHLPPKSDHTINQFAETHSNVLAIKRKGMEPMEYSLPVWLMACTASW